MLSKQYIQTVDTDKQIISRCISAGRPQTARAIKMVKNPKPYIKISHFNVNGLWQSFPGTCRYATFEKAQTLTCSRGYLKV
jgi:hypothetical protein